MQSLVEKYTKEILEKLHTREYDLSSNDRELEFEGWSWKQRPQVGVIHIIINTLVISGNLSGNHTESLHSSDNIITDHN